MKVKHVYDTIGGLSVEAALEQISDTWREMRKIIKEK